MFDESHGIRVSVDTAPDNHRHKVDTYNFDVFSRRRCICQILQINNFKEVNGNNNFNMIFINFNVNNLQKGSYIPDGDILNTQTHVTNPRVCRIKYLNERNSLNRSYVLCRESLTLLMLWFWTLFYMISTYLLFQCYLELLLKKHVSSFQQM